MALLLWAAGILAIVAGMPQLAVATWAVIIINALFAFYQEFKADKTLSNLANMLPNKVKVVRNGESIVLLSEEVTIGDLIILDAGDCVPADARIIESERLTLDNSLLTGESNPVDRNENAVDLTDKGITESTNLVFAGTTVTVGKARAIVYAIGSQTEIGKLSKLTQTIIRGESNLEIQVQKIVRFITKVALVLGLLAFSLAVFGVGLSYKVGFIFALGIIVANIPEGLLPSVSLSLAVGVQRMAKQNALIRRLAAVETLSAVSVICTDKTGRSL
jgi:P-type E1-E2 ATPase